MKFGSTRWDDTTPPPAEIRSAITETEDEQDIRYFKEYQKQGMTAFKHALDVANKIYARGTWRKSGLSWGKWAVDTLHISKTTAYSLPATKNPALQELIKFYEGEGQCQSPSSNPNKTLDTEQAEQESVPNNSQPNSEAVEPPEEPPAQPSKPVPKTDDLGRVIPPHCLNIMARVELELQPLISAASKIHAWADKLGDTGYDPLFAFVFDGHRQDTVEYSHHIQHLLSTCKPQRVCPRCDGAVQAAKRCETCLGAGMISEYRWTHHVIAGTDPKLADKAKAIMVNATKAK